VCSLLPSVSLGIRLQDNVPVRLHTLHYSSLRRTQGTVGSRAGLISCRLLCPPLHLGSRDLRQADPAVASARKYLLVSEEGVEALAGTTVAEGYRPVGRRGFREAPLYAR
jgi:hypothetical protein